MERIQSILRGPPWPSIVLRVNILLPSGGSGRSPDCPAINWGGSGPNSEPWIASVRVLPTLELNSFITVMGRPSPLN